MQPQETRGEVIALDDLFTVEELVALHPKVLSVNTMNWHIRRRNKNGLAHACVKGLRRKLLISKSRFERWLATQTEEGRAAA